MVQVLIKLTLAVVLLFTEVETSKEYGPSISSLTSLSNAVLRLKEFPNYSTLLPLVHNKVTAGSEEIIKERGSMGYEDRSVVVEAPDGFGVMVVIQEMDFGVPMMTMGIGTSPSPNLRKAGMYYNFLKIHDNGDGEVIEISGRVNSTDSTTQPKGLEGTRALISTSGSITITFNLRFLWWYPRHIGIPIYKGGIVNEQHKLAISLTAFTDCEDLPKSANGQESYTSCNPSSASKERCINSKLVCDGVYNCGSDNGGFLGLDEDNCPSSTEDTPEKIKINPNPKDNLNQKYLDSDNTKDMSSLDPDPKKDYISNFNYNYPQHPYQFNQSNSNSELPDHFLNPHISPASIILLIVFTIISVMILGLIIRFCCTKCVGTHPPQILPPPEFTCDHNHHHILDLSSIHVQSQCRRVDYEKDLPPSYEDLFPETEVEKSGMELDNVTFSNSAFVPDNDNIDSNANVAAPDSNLDTDLNSDRNRPIPLLSIPKNVIDGHT